MKNSWSFYCEDSLVDMLLPPQCGHKQPILPPSIRCLSGTWSDGGQERREEQGIVSQEQQLSPITEPGDSQESPLRKHWACVLKSADTRSLTPDRGGITFCKNIMPIKMLRAIQVRLCLSQPAGWEREQWNKDYGWVKIKLLIPDQIQYSRTYILSPLDR